MLFIKILSDIIYFTKSEAFVLLKKLSPRLTESLGRSHELRGRQERRLHQLVPPLPERDGTVSPLAGAACRLADADERYARYGQAHLQAGLPWLQVLSHGLG